MRLSAAGTVPRPVPDLQDAFSVFRPAAGDGKRYGMMAFKRPYGKSSGGGGGTVYTASACSRRCSQLLHFRAWARNGSSRRPCSHEEEGGREAAGAPPP